MIWDSSYLADLNEAAGQQISTDLNCIYNRSFLEIESGTSVYQLPCLLRSLLKITYRGNKIWPINWDQFVALSPNSVFLDAITNIETTISKPRFYTQHPTNILDVRFYPTPSDDFTTSGDPFSPLVNEEKCIVSYYQQIDTTDNRLTLPTYIDRRTRKAYVLWQAFMQEGRGQDLKASEYYHMKYEYLINKFRQINSGCYVSKRYSLGESGIDNYRLPKPVLPSNYERRV